MCNFFFVTNVTFDVTNDTKYFHFWLMSLCCFWKSNGFTIQAGLTSVDKQERFMPFFQSLVVQYMGFSSSTLVFPQAPSHSVALFSGIFHVCRYSIFSSSSLHGCVAVFNAFKEQTFTSLIHHLCWELPHWHRGF